MNYVLYADTLDEAIQQIANHFKSDIAKHRLSLQKAEEARAAGAKISIARINEHQIRAAELESVVHVLERMKVEPSSNRSLVESA